MPSQNNWPPLLNKMKIIKENKNNSKNLNNNSPTLKNK